MMIQIRISVLNRIDLFFSSVTLFLFFFPHYYYHFEFDFLCYSLQPLSIGHSFSIPAGAEECKATFYQWNIVVVFILFNRLYSRNSSSLPFPSLALFEIQLSVFFVQTRPRTRLRPHTHTHTNT